MKFNFPPSKEFEERTKQRFLAVFDVSHLPRTHSRFVTVTKVFAGALGAAAIVLGGASVYADTANVPADNPLYALKRLDETVQLAVTPPAKQADLQASLAARRVGEITDLTNRKPESKIIGKLTADTNAAINASIQDSGKADLGDGALTQLCTKLFSTIATSSATMQDMTGKDSKTLAHFTAKCEAASAQGTNGDAGLQGNNTNANDQLKNNKDGHHGEKTAPAGRSITPNAPTATTTEASTTPADLEFRIHNYLQKHSLNDATTTDEGDGGHNGRAHSQKIK